MFTARKISIAASIYTLYTYFLKLFASSCLTSKYHVSYPRSEIDFRQSRQTDQTSTRLTRRTTKRQEGLTDRILGSTNGCNNLSLRSLPPPPYRGSHNVDSALPRIVPPWGLQGVCRGLRETFENVCIGTE